MNLVSGFERYIFFQNYISLSFSIEGVQSYINYYYSTIKINMYSFVLSDIIGNVLTLVFHSQASQELENDP